MVTSHKEKLIAGAGGAVAILLVFGAMRMGEMELQGQIVLIASMGASAVLLFAVPHGPMSQPWNVLGGHVISALIGVAMHKLVADPVVGAGLAAGLAITAMHYLGCLHPPGGASAVIPVISGPAADSWGWGFAIFPIGFGAVLIILIAILWNAPFPWRRYPPGLWARFKQRDHSHDNAPHSYPDITHADFVAALADLDTFVDISEPDLLRIYEVVMNRHQQD